MKIKIQFLLLILIMGIGCQDSKVAISTNIDSAKVFEDQLLSAALTKIKIEGNVLTADLTLENKTNQLTRLKLTDFVFKCGNNYGEIIQKDQSIATGSWKIPNYEDLNDEEKFTARQDKMQELLQKRVSLFSYWNTEINLDASEKSTRKVEIVFKNKILFDELKFYFNGDYKRLLSI